MSEPHLSVVVSGITHFASDNNNSILFAQFKMKS